VSKSFRAGRLERELQMVQLSATRSSCIVISWVSLMRFAAITLCLASQQVFIVIVISLSTQSGNFRIHPRTFVVHLFLTCIGLNVETLWDVTFLWYILLCRSRDISVGIASGYGLDDRMIGVRFPAEVGNFSLHHRVQTGSGTHPASYPMGTRGSFLGNKAAGALSWPLASIQCQGQRMRGAIPPLPNMSSWRDA
jgi:hypothetical protein